MPQRAGARGAGQFAAESTWSFTSRIRTRRLLRSAACRCCRSAAEEHVARKKRQIGNELAPRPPGLLFLLGDVERNAERSQVTGEGFFLATAGMGHQPRKRRLRQFKAVLRKKLQLSPQKRHR